MSLLEVLLLLAGSAIFIISFRLPVKREEQLEESKELAKEEIKELVDQELTRVREHVEGAVDETITYAVEKTERFMDKMSNEKMMAINEYSDTVIEDIHKSHTEVLFLYDMLNDKYENLKTTAAEVDKTVKEAREVQISTEEPAFVAETKSEPVMDSEPVQFDVEQERVDEGIRPEDEEPFWKGGNAAASDTEADRQHNTAQIGISFADIGMENNNEEILRLHKEGKSKVAIAKELGLGVGEVKLVIDLFEGM